MLELTSLLGRIPVALPQCYLFLPLLHVFFIIRPYFEIHFLTLLLRLPLFMRSAFTALVDVDDFPAHALTVGIFDQAYSC
jgi:hypothetical protein